MFANIYFLNVGALIEKLQDGSFGEVDALKHLIIASIIAGIGLEMPVTVGFYGSEPNGTGGSLEISMYVSSSLVDILTFIVIGVIIYYGYWLLYQANSKGDGKNFFLRINALMLPVFIRIFIVAIIMGLLLALLTPYLSDSTPTIATAIYSIIYSVLDVAIVIAYFIIMRNYIREVASCKI